MFSTVPEQFLNVFASTFFKLCRGYQPLHAMSQWLACTSCRWGVNYLLTQLESCNLPAWALHCSGDIHVKNLTSASLSREWGVDSRHWGPCTWAPNSVALDAKVCPGFTLICPSVRFALGVCSVLSLTYQEPAMIAGLYQLLVITLTNTYVVQVHRLYW